jgi:alpha-L-fucosidase
MKNICQIQNILLATLISACSQNKPVEDIPSTPVVPSEKQIAYQQMELIGFIHFGVNTFTDREWGTGEEDPDIFNPVFLDASQWVETAKMTGMEMLILTAKHHDGFCLWPSAYTNHSVKSSSWKAGNGDVVKALSEACERAGIKFGIYLSPWDMHEPAYGSDAYNKYYLSQLEELLTGYGTVSEVWMDGARGENAKDMEYDFESYRRPV